MATTGKNQYSFTPITDFYLDIANFPEVRELLRNKSPELYTVTPKHQHRPDLLSYDLYGNSNYWWVIVLLNRNQLQDPIRDLEAGMVLRVLSRTDISGVI
jgi:hypothetical protein